MAREGEVKPLFDLQSCIPTGQQRLNSEKNVIKIFKSVEKSRN